MAEWDVPGYTELKKLGSGGFGDVVLARHNASGTPVAIKYLRRDLLADPEFARMFRGEASVLASLNDSNVVRLYEYVESPSGAAIVMEPVDGVSLREILLNQGATTAEAALVVLQGSLLGLAAAHRRGVVHRDYKPENVLVNGDGASKLTDFGIAARAGDRAMPAGTLVYAPPEQFVGAPASPASDVYAATATFYECLAGRPPFGGNTAEVLMHQHMAQPVPLDAVPEPLRPLVIAGMAKEPFNRPADGTSFVNALRAIAAGAYGPDWEQRGRSHLGEAALLLALLWPSSAGPALHGSAAERVNLARHARQTASRPASQPSAESRHIWHLRHLRHVLHLEHLRNLRRRGLIPVKAVVAIAAAIVVASAGTALAVGLNGPSLGNQHPQGSPTPTNSASPGATSSSGSTTPPPPADPAPPALMGISPASGSTKGGTKVIISGTDLGRTTRVTFGGAAGKILSDSNTQITVTSPTGKGTVNIIVTTPDGSSAVTTVGHFMYRSSTSPRLPHPAVTGISPNSGSTTGGTRVTISGTNLNGATEVSFGGEAATIVSDSSTQITVISPAGAGAVNVTVTTMGGASAATTVGKFTYHTMPPGSPRPMVNGISPGSGSTAGRTKVTITGTNLANATGVSFGNTGALIVSDSGTQITVTSPAGKGTVNVTVTTKGGTSGAVQFTYKVPPPPPPGHPKVSGISPASGSTAGGTKVTLTGTSLSGASGVSFGGAAGKIISDSSTQITVTSPAGKGTVNVTVTTKGGTSGAVHFTYAVSAPTVTGISPNGGSTAGGTKVTISGTNLSGATRVSFGSASASIVSDSSTQISVTSPDGSAGTVNVTVTTPGGTSATSSADYFTYTVPVPAPTVTEVKPDSGLTNGGTTVTIVGDNLENATGVSFGGAAATIVSNSDETITVTSPDGSAGTVNVTVTTPGGTSATSSADYFTYTVPVPAPTVTEVKPDSGPAGGGTTVTILGDNLENVTSVHFGSAAATIISNSDETVTVTSPAGEGTVDITVTTAGGTSGISAADHFIYSEPLQ
jgi:protein kinase-like protein/IPT/TIG domain-containing protein